MTLKKDLKKLSRKDLEKAFIYNEREYLRRIDKLTWNLSLLNDNFTNEVVKNAKLVEENKLRIADQKACIETYKKVQQELIHKSYECEGLSLHNKRREELSIWWNERLEENQRLICENCNLKEQVNVDAKTIASLEEDKAELTMEKEQMYLNNKSINDYNSNLETSLNLANRDLREYREKNINLHWIIDVVKQCDRTTVKWFDSLNSDNEFLKFLSTAFWLSTLLLLVLYFIATNG